MTRTATITVVHGRHDHLAWQSAGWGLSTIAPDIRCIVAIDDPGVPCGDCDIVEHVAAEDGELPLARARNVGATRALDNGADVLVFLDVDCVPAPDMLGRYLEAYRGGGARALLSGPVTYLPPPPPGGYRVDRLAACTNPHPARPDPPPGTLTAEANYDLFWSLSFAVSAEAWREVGGFCEEYVGYGGEDTDFAATARARGIPLLWVGGAHAYHQHHPVSDPPVEHLEAIVRNANIFRRRWGRWPMTGWLDVFEAHGLVRRRGERLELGATRETVTPSSA